MINGVCDIEAFHILGCSSDVIDTLVNLYECKDTCPFKPDHRNPLVYTLPPKNIKHS